MVDHPHPNPESRSDSNPALRIGVFDSGVGGLTVLRSLLEHFPQFKFVYVGDTARLPYGTKSPETIRQYSEQILNYLSELSVDAIVIACNTASSQVRESEWNGIPIFNVIDPGARLAVAKTVENRIGVLGTRALVNSRAYETRIRSLHPEAIVFQQACPLFVPLAEEGWIDDPITNLIAFRYLQPLIMQKIDTLVLGCTHYPLLKIAIQKACGKSIQLVESGEAISQDIAKHFQIPLAGPALAQSPANPLSPSEEKKTPSIQLLLTDSSDHLQNLCQEILSPWPIFSFEACDLKKAIP